MINISYSFSTSTREFAENYLHMKPAGGLLTTVPIRCSVGDIMELEVNLKDLRSNVIARGEVIWTRPSATPDHWWIALQFSEELQSVEAEDSVVEEAEDLVGFAPIREGDLIAGKYVCERALGKGGTASVYKVRHVLIDRIAAVKFCNPGGLPPDMNPAELFLREARMVSQLRHDHIVTIYDFGVDPHFGNYLVMEFLEGETLSDQFERVLPFNPYAFYHIARQMLLALGYAHDQGIVHCDMKPANVMLAQVTPGERRKRLKILDFGISYHMTSTAIPEMSAQGLAGSPAYMAPEQIRREPVDARTDLYSIGVILFEMATSTIPFDGTTVEDVLRGHLLKDPPVPATLEPDRNIPEIFDDFILKALEKARENRYQSAKEMLQALDDCFATLGIDPHRRRKGR